MTFTLEGNTSRTINKSINIYIHIYIYIYVQHRHTLVMVSGRQMVLLESC